MQFSNSARAFRLGFALCLAVLGGCVVFGQQFSQYDQVLSPSSNNDQLPCGADDPTCQQAGQAGRTPAVSVPQQSVKGVVIPGQEQQNNQNNTQQNTEQNGNRLVQRKPLPLDAPTEFQQVVANSIGKMLPIYGASLFRTPPSTFAPVNSAPVTPDYLIGPGDQLLVQVWGQVTLDGRYMVDRSGTIYIPQVGTLHVAGLTYAQLHDYLKAQFGRIFRNFDLSVSMGQLRSIQVFVVGQARQPGSYTISALSTLTNAIFATGGPSPAGSLRHIVLKREGKVIVDFDMYDLLERGDKSQDVRLLPGDVIYIPPVGPQVAVAGSVNVPAIYELKSDKTTVGDVLGLAAGLTSTASGKEVRLERIDEGHNRSIMELSLDAQGQSTALRNGDLLEVTAMVDQYKDAVTLRGNVANPGRYMWRPGMRVLDLIPNKEALITRDYWLRQSQLGQPTLTYVPTCAPQTVYGLPSLRYGISPGDEGEHPNWRYSSVRKNPYLVGMPFGSPEGATDGVPGLDQYGQPTSDGGLNCVTIPGSETSATGMNDIYTPPPNQQTTAPNGNNNTDNSANGSDQENGGMSTSAHSANATSSAQATVGTDNSSSFASQFKPRNEVKLTEPDIDWSYAVIERQNKENLTTVLLPFNLGKAVLDGDASQNLELIPGDVVTIFSKSDLRVPQEQRTRFVRLEGEFESSGVYSVKPGETLRELVQRAGGLTPDAYLYGSEFTRESERRVQQQRLNQYVNQIALQVSTAAINSANSAISAQDSAALAAAQQQNRNVVNSLRQAKATGRIVLNLAPGSRTVADLPDLPLEDGDQFVVPHIPSTVSVEGAVYNANSFVYDPAKRLGDYVHLAGGANRDADKSRAFVIRASGAVVSSQYSSSLRGHSFDSLRLYPGDTVVIPLNLNKGKSLRLIVDLSQIVGQLGIAIAAANVVF
ncbi:hypothetical protein GCM10011507_33900 [Edaphobacter acidisoli]|uniref:Sugar transporter n=1 Tax=Edaphobacter acidisoli TaxID=2040573 RepID=A0A916S149_9BACT|nr:SLBB domain-containing protein [Edaphobacter acidisoli]GGA79865.1 hypothetical protein GCM10011507_33900 [Edaphobacter acidisoli]